MAESVIDSFTLFESIKDQHNYTFSLKKEQADILDYLRKKENVLGLLPTSFGKSILYAAQPLLLNQV